MNLVYYSLWVEGKITHLMDLQESLECGVCLVQGLTYKGEQVGLSSEALGGPRGLL